MYKLKTYNGITYEIFGKEVVEEKWSTAIKESLITLAKIAGLFILAYGVFGALYGSAMIYHANAY